MDYNQSMELKALVSKVSNAIKDSEKLFVSNLAGKAKKVAELHPGDSTSVSMSNFLTRRANAEKLLMTKAELKEVYNTYFTSNNKFSTYFGKELDITEQEPERKMTRDPKEGESLITATYEKVSDPMLANHLAAAFDSSVQMKVYSDAAAKNAKRVCAHELNCCGTIPNKIDVVAGNEAILICRAAYSTPCGENAVFIPIELKGNAASLPGVFLAKEGFVDINKSNIIGYLQETSSKPLKVNAQSLLRVVSEAKNGTQPLDDVERIIMKAAAAKETPATLAGLSIIGQVIDEDVKPLADVTYEQPEEVISIAKQITSRAGAAEFIFGKTVVESGREQVLKTVKLAGYQPQVKVLDNTEDTIFYAVSVGSQGSFKVPVKVANGKATLQRIIVSNGGLYELTSAGISEYLAGGTFDGKTAAVSSQLSGASASEAIELIRRAMGHQDYITAEDALNVLKQSGDSVAYQTGFNVYKEGLKAGGDIKKEASIKKTCNMQVKTRHSQHVLCGHLGVPIEKTYVDEHGNCQPLYRKKMAETQDGQNVSFISSKVLLGS
jgi:hypothetical protein